MRATLRRLLGYLSGVDPLWCISVCGSDERLRINAPLLLERCGEVTSSIAELLAIPLPDPQRRLVLCDDGLSDGGAEELVHQLRQRHGHQRCRVLVFVDDDMPLQRLQQLWHCGPDGLIAFQSYGSGAILQAILSVIEGVSCCDPQLQRRLQQPARPLPGPGRCDAEQLNARERALIQAVARGHTSQQIGALLQLRDDTVRRQLSGLYRRLGVNDQRGLIAWALQQGVIRSCDLRSC